MEAKNIFIVVLKMLVFLAVFLFLSFALFYFSLFRLTSAQVDALLQKSSGEYNLQLNLSNKSNSLNTQNQPNLCTSIKDCEFMPGDMLIRRYITEDTERFEKVMRPFLTHSTFYIGNGEVVEAVGSKPDIKDEVVKEPLHSTDWMNSDIEKWVIVRPLFIKPHIQEITKSLKDIADDPDYGFGLFDKIRSKLPAPTLYTNN
jgi:hypothetical protein